MQERDKRRVLAGVMLSIFLAAMESTVVATAMPTVVTSLGGLHIYSWVFSGFLLTSTVTMPLWGRLSDLYGRRRMFLLGLAIFLGGSALSGLARSMGELIAFRMLQGLGAGSLMTIGMTIVGDIFTIERRARSQGYLSGVWGVASLIGPLLGGFLTDHVSWRWVFYINLPFGAVAMGLIGTSLREDPSRRRRPVIDYWGLGLFAIGVSTLLLAAVEAGRSGGWTGLAVAAPAAVSVVALAAFVAVERRAREPIVPLGLFANRMVLAAMLTGFFSGMAMFGAISFVPLFVQHVSGATATGAGTVLIPFVLGWVLMSIVSARVVLRIGYRTPVLTGMVFLTGAFVLFSRWAEGLTQLGAMRDVLLAGVGMGMIFVPMLIGVQGAVARTELGVATSVTQFFRAVGGAIGLSLMGAVMAQRLHAGRPMDVALQGAFFLGLVVCLAALASALVVPAGRARDLARADIRGEPTRVGG
jgi:EmrB/QacA subfamily drug resistance transporter